MFRRHIKAITIVAVAISVLTVIFIIMILSMPRLNENRQLQGANPAAAPDMVSTVSGTPEKRTRILFMGSDYIVSNNLPGMLVGIASSDTKSRGELEVQQSTRADVTLNELWISPKARGPLLSQSWDYVVLQQQGFWALTLKSIVSTFSLADEMKPYLAKAGAKPVVFVSWAMQPGSHWYSDAQTSGDLKDPSYMQQQLDASSMTLADRLGGITIPVGDFWAYALKLNPNWSQYLYYIDGSRPGPAGSYLTALVFYRFLTGRSPLQTTYVPSGVKPEAADELRKIAAAPIAEVLGQE